jgi:integrase
VGGARLWKAASRPAWHGEGIAHDAGRKAGRGRVPLLELFEPREGLAIEIAGWFGTRRSEGFGLKWKDIDLKRGVVAFRQGFVSGRISQLKTEASRKYPN